ncbi:hypothetical protein E2C01_043056 [Portunus trituberculatus]|uniref:Uncharacterized protein n=1 Tax=Portunus trituberculatus TaxID=210409 RepID=A0A5B7FWG5_PORTR|nr:hypothetical protein [Portunus trituberculatus]
MSVPADLTSNLSPVKGVRNFGSEFSTAPDKNFPSKFCSSSPSSEKVGDVDEERKQKQKDEKGRGWMKRNRTGSRNKRINIEEEENGNKDRKQKKQEDKTEKRSDKN